MKTAIIHEWFDSYAGSEKCVESFNNIWPVSDIYCIVDFLSEEVRKKIIKDKVPTTSFIQHLPFAKNHFRNYLALFPVAIEQFDLSEYNTIISSSHAVSKGIITNSNQLHICYCHTPMRYAWDLYHQYLKESGLTRGVKSIVARMMLHYLRIWDYNAAQRVDHFIANSHYIARRIRKVYGKEAEVIYPPIDVSTFKPETNKDNFYLTVSRFVPYKRIDLIAEAFSQMPDKKLVIIGDGPDMEKVKSKASNNIEILGHLPSEELSSYMKKAKAFVFAAEEDFGIVVIEAMACGTPVIALNKGGTAETVIDSINGIHFENQKCADIIQAVNKFERISEKLDPLSISNYAQGFSREIFERKIQRYVEDKYSSFINTGHIH